MHIFYPREVNWPPRGRPRGVVFIAPAGSILLTGKLISRSDYPECIPWAKAGYLVVLYSLDGSPDGLGHAPNNAELKDCFLSFAKSQSGLANFAYARAYVRTYIHEAERVPLITVGHSSASVVALLAAESGSRVGACVVFGTVPNLLHGLGANRVQLQAELPGLGEFLERYSPDNHLKELHCPLFVFHAEDDQVAPINRVEGFVEGARPFSSNLTFERVATGGHSDAMLRDGIPLAIQWVPNAGKPVPHRPNPGVVAAEPNPVEANPNSPQPREQPDKDARPGRHERRLGRGEDPEKVLTDRLKSAVTFNPAAVGNLVAARLIVGPDEKLVQALRRSPGLGRPLVSMRFVLARPAWMISRTATPQGRIKGAP